MPLNQNFFYFLQLNNVSSQVSSPLSIRLQAQAQALALAQQVPNPSFRHARWQARGIQEEEEEVRNRICDGCRHAPQWRAPSAY
jgi:hypothetical protein